MFLGLWRCDLTLVPTSLNSSLASVFDAMPPGELSLIVHEIFYGVEKLCISCESNPKSLLPATPLPNLLRQSRKKSGCSVGTTWARRPWLANSEWKQGGAEITGNSVLWPSFQVLCPWLEFAFKAAFRGFTRLWGKLPATHFGVPPSFWNVFWNLLLNAGI